MSGRIPQSFIDELMNRVDIVDVIDSRVQLKKKGHEYTACCPFHTEKTPSFTVSPSKQFYHCFGCGAHGTALGFLMDYEHLSFPEAIEELAGTVGLEVPREAVSQVDHKPQHDLYDIMEQADVFFRKQLRVHPTADKAVSYLKNRGMSGEIAAEFGIGYAPPGWQNLLDALGTSASAQKLLIEAGLVIEKGRSGPYDRFRDRIMIPIRDRRGRVIAFGGRILDGDEGGAKYLNSPETPIFHKGRELYGLFEARKALRHPQHLMVVEGYMDVLALVQFDIRYAVATLGTATTKDHLEALYRVVPKVVFCFDGDRAGKEAAWRALENALPVMQEGRQATFLFLPDGEDPDSLVRKEGKEAFEARIHDAMPLSTFFYEKLSIGLDLSIPDDRARLVKLARPLLARLPDNIFHHMMVENLAELVGIKSNALKSMLQGDEPTVSPDRKPAKTGKTRTGRRTPVRLAITLLLQNPHLSQQVNDSPFLEHTDLPGADLLHKMLEILHQNPNLSTAALLERWRDQPEWEPLCKLAQEDVPGSEESLATEFLDTVKHLQMHLKRQRWETLQEKLHLEGLNDEELSEWKQLLEELPASKK
jgi:DNA primase